MQVCLPLIPTEVVLNQLPQHPLKKANSPLVTLLVSVPHRSDREGTAYRPVGTITINLHLREISNLGVLREYQSLGFGSLLVEAAESVTALQIAKYELDTSTDSWDRKIVCTASTSLVPLFERRGWSQGIGTLLSPTQNGKRSSWIFCTVPC